MQSRLRFADVFSLLNATFGFLGICVASNGNLILAAKFIMISVLMDGIDGFVARKKGGSDLGRELDSLADLVSFGVLPSLILFKMNLLYVSIPYLLANIYRLARFNVLRYEDFLGLPTTASALFFACLIIADFPHIYAVALILSILMVSGVRYVKVRNKVVLAIVGVIILLSLFLDTLIYINLILTLAYIISPIFKVRL
ncbi:CDP-diacylglycerol/serine O-phosphatidyltransferase [Archaeoglobus profundus DSM 5631]|uniref:CDP-diacylglycerol--serine O-phosphatidyltransferase n=1 Tax=Archaeoglobus profundus (strain DSM 5631 / JCM 9629 / NBRC 100127 / Av18) TaxID=572546 RepID=D2RI07_ARCPA|nr:CDP-diacylglycerol/serine O-phosphatidyltransferase [Archaeoglobus profundus DSM 5631]